MKNVPVQQVSQINEELSVAPLVAFDEEGDIPYPNHPFHPKIISTTKQIEEEEEDRTCCHLCYWKRFRRDFCHILSQFFFSQIGLTILVFFYVALGGFIFYAIESKYEMKKNEEIQLEHSRGIRNIRLIATEEFNWMLNASFELRYALWRGMISRHDLKDNSGWRVHVNSERFDRLIDQELTRMQAEQEKLADKHDSRSDVSHNQKWTFSTAMLYSATVITTVGYGNIAPKSVLGKVMTCVYAMFGIPIMIMCLTNTGDLLAFFFIKYYSWTIHRFRRMIDRRRCRRRKATSQVNLDQNNFTLKKLVFFKFLERRTNYSTRSDRCNFRCSRALYCRWCDFIFTLGRLVVC